MTRFFPKLIVGLLLLLPFAVSQAIIIRHDRADSRYQVDENDYPQLFYLHTSFENKVCIGTLISSRWAITAAHCTQQTPLLDSINNNKAFGLNIAGQSYLVEDLVLHPRFDTGKQLDNVDLALIRLDREVAHIIPVGLNRNTDEANRVMALLGWGFTGIGTRGLQNNDGKLRRAENRVVEAGQWLTFLFDDPRVSGSEALMLEGVPGLGDSGGPALMETENGPVLVGIALGELEDGPSPSNQGMYGTLQIYERISSHLDWIDSVISH